MAVLNGVARSEFMVVFVGESHDEVTRRLLEMTMRSHNWDKAAVAKVLGVSRKTIYNWLAAYELDKSDPIGPYPPFR